MNYTVLRTDTFDEQLSDIILYIAEDSGSVDRALRTLDSIEKDILHLSSFPESGTVPRYRALRAKGYRVLVTGRWLVFYRIHAEKKTVTLYAITDQRREYQKIL